MTSESLFPYLNALFFRRSGSVASSEWLRFDELQNLLVGLVQQALDEKQWIGIDVTDYVKNDLTDFLVSKGIIKHLNDPRAGDYFRINNSNLVEVAKKRLLNDEVHIRANEVGERFWPDLIRNFYVAQEIEFPEGQASVVVPSMTTVVSLQPSEVAEFEEPLGDLESELKKSNGIADQDGLKELLLGQVRAGRELLRAGEIKSYVLYVTLFKALEELVRRYKDHVIGEAAKQLIALLVKHVFASTS